MHCVKRHAGQLLDFTVDGIYYGKYVADVGLACVRDNIMSIASRLNDLVRQRGFDENMLVRLIVIPVVNYFTRNVTYTVQFGNTQIKKKGGIQILRLGGRNLREEQFLCGLDLRGKTVFDIGAYIGILSSLFGKSVGTSGRVIAFEPNPENYKEVKKTVALNGLHNVDVLNIGIADSAGVAKLAVRYNTTATSSMDPATQARILSEGYTGLVEVVVDTLDHCLILNKLPPPDFIKIDIEGVEYRALTGMTQVVDQYSPDLYIEIHGVDMPSRIANINQVMGWLQYHHYGVFHVESQKPVAIENAEAAAAGHIFCSQR
jgi:FkbM family methyltransferase